MKNSNRDQGDAEYSNITPAEISLTKGKENPHSTTHTGVTRKKRLWLVPFLILVIVAAGVVFILPGHIQVPSLQVKDPAPPNSTSAVNSNSSQSSGSSATAATESSPFQEAQEARQRNRSQELLSEILKLQRELEDNNVLVWGADRYNSILELAKEGDAAYRVRDFVLSVERYAGTLTSMQTLLEDMETIFNDSITKGNEALNQGLSLAAREEFDFALLIKPDNNEAMIGLDRSTTLDQVLALITEGDDLQQNNNLEEAREKYQQALALDSRAETARQNIRDVNTKITERDFNKLMSDGYRQLQVNELEKARTSFQRAGKLKPNAADVAAALNQAQTSITNQKINGYLQTAVHFESQEKWEEAVTEYQKALALDTNLAQAQEGKRYAQSRATLDSRLKQIISEPQRLSNKAVYEETRIIHQQAMSIPAPEPGLVRQIDIIQNLLNYAVNPIEITFNSDNMTNVTIYKVGTLGKFEERSLGLLPGNYVATGTREGYRDVRVEFSVQAENRNQQNIIITAVDKIASR